MHKTIIIMAVLSVIGLTQVAMAAVGSNASDNRKAEENKSLTVEDLGRGLKSAAKNIENEIPKFGSAIGSAVKKITGTGQEKSPSQEPAKQHK